MTFKKNVPFQTVNPGQTIIFRASPVDANKGEVKNFYIVELIDREGIGAAAYKTVMKAMEPEEVKKLLGLKKKDMIRVY